MHTYSDDRGRSLLSVFDHLSDIPGQINTSLMYAGAVKAWHRHARQEDHWAVLAGNLKVGLYNTEAAALRAELRLATSVPNEERVVPIEVPAGTGQAVYLGEHRPGVLRIPTGLWHGGVAVGGRDAVLLYYVTRRYDAQNPDEERETWDHFPFNWRIEFR
jgi:dTDP-4-dehydrorhamnose 3,5-epimerase